MHGFSSLLATFLCVLAVTLLVPGCTPSKTQQVHNDVQGTLRADETGEPLEGAYVLVHWRASEGASHSEVSGCTWISATKTDPQGRFALHADLEKMVVSGNGGPRMVKGGRPEIFIYAAGREEAGRRVFTGKRIDPVRGVPLTVQLAKQAGDSHDRLRSLHRQARNSIESCPNYDNLPAIRSFYTAIAREASELAGNAYEAEIASRLTALAKEYAPGTVPGGYNNFTDYLPTDVSGYDQLLIAAKHGDPGRVADLITAGAAPNRLVHTFDPNVYSALTQAIKSFGEVQDPTPKITAGSVSGAATRRTAIVTTPLNYPQYLAIAKLLLSTPNIDPDLRPNTETYTPLMLAIQLNQAEIVRLLLAAGANPALATSYGINARHLLQDDIRRGRPRSELLALLDEWDRTHQAPGAEPRISEGPTR